MKRKGAIIAGGYYITPLELQNTRIDDIHQQKQEAVFKTISRSILSEFDEVFKLIPNDDKSRFEYEARLVVINQVEFMRVFRMINSLLVNQIDDDRSGMIQKLFMDLIAEVDKDD